MIKRQDSRKQIIAIVNSGNARPKKARLEQPRKRQDVAKRFSRHNQCHQSGIGIHWEHRSFAEQGIDKEPTIHIGATANALERKGI
ncbi:MAG: MobA/MobL family protein [Lachnospiraceae bacterium]|nr:MobA/MobL family protein [Lachnospiraceae bacterium]